MTNGAAGTGQKSLRNLGKFNALGAPIGNAKLATCSIGAQ
jgi:hypothetical protein